VATDLLLPVVGDWTNSGYDSVGVYDATTAHIFLKNTLNTGNPDTQFVFGNPNWLPITGRWYQQGPYPTNTPHPTLTNLPTNTPTATPSLTNTPIAISCTASTKAITSTYRGPSMDDMQVQTNVPAITMFSFVASAIDESDGRWYGFLDSSRGLDKNGQSVLSWISASFISEQGAFNCLSTLPDRSIRLVSPLPIVDTWNVYLGTVVPQLPIAPGSLSIPNPSYRGFGPIAASDYSLINGCRHPGFDFPTTGGTSIVSMSDGIVVGMGNTQDFKVTIRRPGAWGSVDYSGFSGVEYNLVIRSGAHFILYGHLAQIALSLSYGSQVQAGDAIGTVD